MESLDLATGSHSLYGRARHPVLAESSLAKSRAFVEPKQGFVRERGEDVPGLRSRERGQTSLLA